MPWLADWALFCALMLGSGFSVQVPHDIPVYVECVKDSYPEHGQ